MSVIWHANAANEIGIYVADFDTPSVPSQSATIQAIAYLEGTQVGATKNTSTFISTLVFPDNKIGGYIVSWTAAEITAIGRTYRVVITITIAATLVETIVLFVPCVENRGS